MNLFNALSGTETLEVILGKIRQDLENTGAFRGNLAFPLLKVEYTVKVWNGSAQDFAGEPGVSVSGQAIERQFALPGEEDKPSITVAESTVIDTPDKARVETNLPIPKTTIGPKGVKVDTPSKVMPRKDAPLLTPTRLIAEERDRSNA